MKRSLIFRVSLFIGVFGIIAISLGFAQTFVGDVRGLVQDPGGAVIANAHVTLTNEGTGVSRSTVTNAQGEYVFTQLEPATYSISVEAQGFKKLQRPGVIVGTQETVSVDVRMEIGQISESVQVTSEVPLIENANASNGQVLDSQKMTDLPNLGCNPFLLSTLSAGVRLRNRRNGHTNAIGVNVGPPPSGLGGRPVPEFPSRGEPKHMKLRVECYSGHKADERPVRFHLDDREYLIEELLDQWYGPDDVFFKVRADDGNLYVLRHQLSGTEDVWHLEAFRQLHK